MLKRSHLCAYFQPVHFCTMTTELGPNWDDSANCSHNRQELISPGPKRYRQGDGRGHASFSPWKRLRWLIHLHSRAVITTHTSTHANAHKPLQSNMSWIMTNWGGYYDKTLVDIPPSERTSNHRLIRLSVWHILITLKASWASSSCYMEEISEALR